MPKFRVVPEERFRELERIVERAAEILAEAGDLSLPDSLPLSRNGQGAESGKKYHISRSGWQYADVVDREMKKSLFSLDEVWQKVEPLIEATAERPRDGLRVALDRDERFERLEARQGVWWRRVSNEEEEEHDAVTEE